MALVEAERYGNSLEAGAALARLEAEGIMSFLFDLEMSPFGFEGPMIRLMVDEDDLADARRILEIG